MSKVSPDKIGKVVENIVSGKYDLWDIVSKLATSEKTIFDKAFRDELSSLKGQVSSTHDKTNVDADGDRLNNGGDKINGDGKFGSDEISKVKKNLTSLVELYNNDYFDVSELHVSDEFLDRFKTEEFEGVRLEAYPDGTINKKKNYSIGYGHSGAKPGETISQEQADKYLRDDIKKYSDYIREYVKVPLTQNMFDALFSFVYNAGHKKLEKVAVFLNNNDVKGATDYMKSIVYWTPHGKKKKVINSGLVKRREREVALLTKDLDIPSSMIA